MRKVKLFLLFLAAISPTVSITAALTYCITTHQPAWCLAFEIICLMVVLPIAFDILVWRQVEHLERAEVEGMEAEESLEEKNKRMLEL